MSVGKREGGREGVAQGPVSPCLWRRAPGLVRMEEACGSLGRECKAHIPSLGQRGLTALLACARHSAGHRVQHDSAGKALIVLESLADWLPAPAPRYSHLWGWGWGWVSGRVKK